MTLIVGLSGGIGSGKSTVANFFRELGAVVIDADVIVHELQAAGEPLLKELSTAFGAEGTVCAAPVTITGPCSGVRPWRSRPIKQSIAV